MRDTAGKRVRGRMRRLGWSFVIILVPVLLSALNTGTNLLYLISGGLVSFMVLSAVLSSLALRGLRMRRDCPQAVHRGQALPVRVRVHNSKPLLASISVRVENAEAPAAPLGYAVRIPARRAVELQTELVFNRRGHYRLPPFDLVTAFPFGLMERRLRFDDGREVLVYPRVHAVRTGAVEKMQGTQHASRTPVADGSEFFSLREYVPGDDMRHIAWRISARLGAWMVREMAHDSSRNIGLVLDACVPLEGPEAEDRFEEAVELVASLAISLLNRQYRVGLALPGVLLDLGEGAGHGLRILKALAELAAAPPAQRESLEAHAQSLVNQGATPVVVSPDPAAWGRPDAISGARTLHPREVAIHA
jgi:uncharacterized protein (DUF58 family)